MFLYTAKVDATPLDVRQMAKAAYRGHVKFEVRPVDGQSDCVRYVMLADITHPC
jgi:hypothetical protein